MAWGWLDRKRVDSPDWTGFLDQGIKLEGKIEAKGTLRIDSAMKGTLISEGVLILGEHASVEGQIEGNCVVIAGRFDGTIQAKARVEIQPRGIVTGNIFTPCLIIEPGAIFDGQCHMPGSSESAKPVVIPIRSSVQATQ